MPLTVRRLNRATLARQMLLQREALGVAAAVRRVVALQAQEPASPYLALWNRIDGFDPADLDRAFSGGEVVKAPLMRVTLHAVAADEYTTFHEAMLGTLRAARLNDRRFRSTGLTVEDADALLSPLSDFTATPRTKADIENVLGEHLGGPPEKGVWWALRTYAPLTHHPTGGAWSFGRSQHFAVAPVAPSRATRERSVQRLIVRYLEGFGPASARDVGQFTILRMAEVRPALRALGPDLHVVAGPDGGDLYDVPGGLLPDESTPAPPRLMAMWDSILLAYADRSRVIPEEYRKVVIRNNGDVLPTMLVDGYVCGVWRPATDRGIEATAFHALPDAAWESLETEAAALTAFLAERDPSVYSRYGRWWNDLPAIDVRVLAG